MQEYKGFFYWQDSRKLWWVKYPSGFKSVLPNVTTEDEAKARIGEIVGQA